MNIGSSSTVYYSCGLSGPIKVNSLAFMFDYAILCNRSSDLKDIILVIARKLPSFSANILLKGYALSRRHCQDLMFKIVLPSSGFEP